MRVAKPVLAVVLAAYLVLCLIVYAVVHDLPDPADRTVVVSPAEGGCVLRIHGVVHGIAPASECVSIGRALIQVASR